MKKSKLKKLKLKKESVSKLDQRSIKAGNEGTNQIPCVGGGSDGFCIEEPSPTCQSPCEGGTTSCQVPPPQPCYTANGAESCRGDCTYSGTFRHSSPA